MLPSRGSGCKFRIKCRNTKVFSRFFYFSQAETPYFQGFIPSQNRIFDFLFAMRKFLIGTKNKVLPYEQKQGQGKQKAIDGSREMCEVADVVSLLFCHIPAIP